MRVCAGEGDCAFWLQKSHDSGSPFWSKLFNGQQMVNLSSRERSAGGADDCRGIFSPFLRVHPSSWFFPFVLRFDHFTVDVSFITKRKLVLFRGGMQNLGPGTSLVVPGESFAHNECLSKRTEDGLFAGETGIHPSPAGSLL